MSSRSTRQMWVSRGEYDKSGSTVGVWPLRALCLRPTPSFTGTRNVNILIILDQLKKLRNIPSDENHRTLRQRDRLGWHRGLKMQESRQRYVSEGRFRLPRWSPCKRVGLRPIAEFWPCSFGDQVLPQLWNLRWLCSYTDQVLAEQQACQTCPKTALAELKL